MRKHLHHNGEERKRKITDLEASPNLAMQSSVVYMTDRISPLKIARLASGLSMPKLAGLAGTSAQQIDRLERGERKLTKEWAERIAPHLGLSAQDLLFPRATPSINKGPVLIETPQIPFRGVAAAGVWMEHDDLAQDAPILPSIPGAPAGIQFAVRVAGPSMDLKGITHGDYLLCLNYFDARSDLTSGDVVIVERRRAGTVERTCKELVVKNGRFELWPRSSDGRYQDPIVIPDKRSPIAEDGTEVEVVGLVKAVHRVFG